jgi:uncharacterized membrane protein YwaF
MDILAHALWTTAAAAKTRQQIRRPIRLGWAAFWGVFPDLFSFAVPLVLKLWWYATGVTSFLRPDANSAQRLKFVWQLYNCSHSLVVFAAVFGIVWALAKRPVLEMLGWGLHILIDIATHQGIFAVHFLWPFSSYSVSGLRWENPWFMAINYGALAMVYLWMWVSPRRRTSHERFKESELKPANND